MTGETEIKVLTVRQPWAWAILHAGKDIENRTWSTDYRGTLVIHAAAKLHRHTAMPPGVRGPERDELIFGAMLGMVDLVDVVTHSESRWFDGPYGWVMENPRALSDAFFCKGRLGLWTTDAQTRHKLNYNLQSSRRNAESSY
jgi:hypothetical protein